MTETLRVYPPRPFVQAPGTLRDFAAELNPQQAAACPIDKASGVSSADIAKRYGSELVP